MKRERFTTEDISRVGEPSSGDLGTGDGKARARGGNEPGGDELLWEEQSEGHRRIQDNRGEKDGA